MRVKYKELILECDWAIRHEDKVVFGTRSKDVFYFEDCDASSAIDALTSKGFWKTENLGVVKRFYVNDMADLLREGVFDSAVFDKIPGGRANTGAYYML